MCWLQIRPMCMYCYVSCLLFVWNNNKIPTTNFIDLKHPPTCFSNPIFFPSCSVILYRCIHVIVRIRRLDKIYSERYNFMRKDIQLRQHIAKTCQALSLLYYNGFVYVYLHQFYLQHRYTEFSNVCTKIRFIIYT